MVFTMTVKISKEIKIIAQVWSTEASVAGIYGSACCEAAFYQLFL